MNFKLLLEKLKRKIKGGAPTITELRLRGVTIGEDCHIYGSIDYSHGYLVSMGDHVTLAAGCRLLTHDGSTKKVLGYSKVGRIEIGSNVFIGAASVILPNIKIGNRVIIGAGSIVTHDVPDNAVVVGNPARVIGTYDDFVAKNQQLFESAPVWETHFSKRVSKKNKK